MLKPLLLGAAMAIALPAIAQTTGTMTPDMNKPGTGTDMNAGTMAGQTSPGVSDQANMGNCSQGAAASTARSANRRGARGTAASTCGTMQGSSTTTASSDSDWGRTGATGSGTTAGTTTRGMGGSTAGTTGGTMTGSAGGTTNWNGGTGSYTGQGGPLETGKTYPTCSRTITDNCMQRGGSRHARSHRR
jgi:hypothetical protein